MLNIVLAVIVDSIWEGGGLFPLTISLCKITSVKCYEISNITNIKLDVCNKNLSTMCNKQ